MGNVAALLENFSHRPWQLPRGKWRYYQEWKQALFLHWKFPVDIVQQLVPAGLEVDTISGSTWISLVAFKMENVRLRGFPAFPPVSNFQEINVRAYVSKNGKPGVYFLSIEAQKALSAFVSKTVSGLPYQKADITTQEQNGLHLLHSRNRRNDYFFEALYEPVETIYTRTALDSWLTERYCLYLDDRGKLFLYEIHHPEWNLQHVKLQAMKVNYKNGCLSIKDRPPDLMHFSEGVNVISWKREEV